MRKTNSPFFIFKKLRVSQNKAEKKSHSIPLKRMKICEILEKSTSKMRIY